MRAIPQYFEFQNPTKILAGEDALLSFKEEWRRLNSQRPLIITDKGILKFGLFRKVKEALQDPELTSFVFDEVPPDSSLEVVKKAAKMFRDHQCDSLIAIGGGSVIDTAKGVNIVISEGTEDLSSLMGHDRLTQPQKPLIVIPTTSGTGSEVTLVSVIADTARQQKMLFTSSLLQPTLTVIDPEMTRSLPPLLTAATAMDALTHAIEAYTCLQKNPFSDAFAQVAIELIAQNILIAVNNGENKDARYRLAIASTAAGVAFSNSMVGAVHGIGHTVGALAHVHHGTAMAILLPHVMRYNLDEMTHLYAPIYKMIEPECQATLLSDIQKAQFVIKWIKEINQHLNLACNMPDSLEKAGLKQEQLPEIAQQSLNDGAMIANPKEIDAQDALDILNNAFFNNLEDVS
jgi:alcohol dehydrogenase